MLFPQRIALNHIQIFSHLYNTVHQDYFTEVVEMHLNNFTTRGRRCTFCSLRCTDNAMSRYHHKVAVLLQFSTGIGQLDQGRFS